MTDAASGGRSHPLKARLIAELREAWAEMPWDADRRARADQVLRFLPARALEPGAPVVASALVRVRPLVGSAAAPGPESWVFLLPSGEGGFITDLDGRPAQALTHRSPLGAALLGRFAGDRVSVPSPRPEGEAREFEILEVV